MLYVDIETCDPCLRDTGPGWVRDEGFIAGIGVGTEDCEWYFPIRHEDGFNMDPKITLRWLNDTIKRVGTAAAFNSGYDFGWLHHEGVEVPQKIIDPQASTALLDENRMRYDLDSVCRDWGLPGKDEEVLKEAAQAYGLHAKRDLWRLAPKYVGSYGEQDVAALRALWHKHEKELRESNLWSIWELEMALMPLNMEMKRRGVRIDPDAAEQLNVRWIREEKEIRDEIHRKWGVRPDIWSGDSLGKACDKIGIGYPLTPKTQKPSFTQKWLEDQHHEFCTLLVKARKISKARNTYVDSFIGKYAHKGRIHPDWNPLKAEREDGSAIGTVSGRYSSGNPSLQVIPSVEKSPEMGTLLRALFLPEEGTEWLSADYSRQEPTLCVHYASLLGLPGSGAAVRAHKEARVDFHTMMSEMSGVPRPAAKIICLAIIYGMGVGRLCNSLNLDENEGKALINKFNRAAPYLKRLADRCSTKAQDTGVIKTILGRHCRFDDWEPVLEWGVKPPPPLDYEAAKRAIRDPANKNWFNKSIRRAFTHKALNRLIQGSAADQMKKAMLECYREGIKPMIQMHDEIGVSVESEKISQRVSEIMVHAVELEIPIHVDLATGKNWGEAV
jgi:DNA polymerase I-like protein with 3'-5' exonuclease and polymerase domains